MKDLSISLIQTPLHWENGDANMDMFTEKINKIHTPTDVIVLPEMFTTGFSINSVALAEDMNGKAVQWLTTMAKEKKCVITGSVIIKENDHYFNRLIWMQPDGTYNYYNKRHLFRMGDEHQHFSAGKEKVIVEIKNWKICLSICYDLRFPVWYRNTLKTNGMEYDCLLCVANWPEIRNFAWKTLLQARAIENQVYVIGVNRIGIDGNGKTFSGDSAVINAHGQLISTTLPNQENIETVFLSYQELENYRKSFPVGLDGDIFEVK